MTEREIWFERVGPPEPFASYMPIHWKGWAVLAAQLSLALTLMLPALSWSKRHASPYGTVIAVGIFLLFFFWIFITANKHSAPRSGENGSVG